VRWSTQVELSTHVAEVALLAIPMGLIVIAGGIDLSVGSIMALAAVTLGLAYEAGAPLSVSCLCALVAGGAAGALNGSFVAFARIHPLIVTLATLAAFRGLAEGISLGRPMSGFPGGLLRIGSQTVAGLPTLVWCFLVAGALAAGALALAVRGRWIFAVGGNARASRGCGVPARRLTFALYTLSGVMAGVAAVAFVARRNTAKADVGTGIELDVITAVVLGGVSIFGGRGTIAGTLLGVLLIHEVREFVSWRWQSDELILLVIGTILIGSVLLGNVGFTRRMPWARAEVR
jgi:rhamnose transport system permease protein